MTMNMKAVFGFLALLILCGCKSYEGVYEPDCIAYEGDKIYFAEGQFKWERFTDAINIGDDGNPIDPFPDFPREGTYRIDGENVYMSDQSGVALDHMYLHEIKGRYYLLTEDQDYARDSEGELAKCVLVLQTEE